MAPLRLNLGRALSQRAPAAAVCAVAALSLGGCASHRLSPSRAGIDGRTAADQPPPESLASYIARVRALTAAARPQPSVGGQTLETWDTRLSAALMEVSLAPTAAGHRRVASEYRRLGVLDMAHTHLTAAVRLDPSDAAAHDGLARIWRDWGFADLGLADAYLAVSLAPTSPVAANTLGTLHEASGRIYIARRWYQRALALDPNAPYALTNVCYTAVMLEDTDAVSACRRALAADPASRVARNNLGLAFAAEGSFDQAREQFQATSDAAAVHYNMGILYMARGQYTKAAQSFDAAFKARPELVLAARRGQQAREAAWRTGRAAGARGAPQSDGSTP